MRKYFIFLFLIITQFSCNMFQDGETNYYKKVVNIKQLKDLDTNNSLWIRIPLEKNFELQISISKIIKFINFSSEKDLNRFYEIINQIVTTKDKILSIPELKFGGHYSDQKFWISEPLLFKSGEYLIYSIKEMKYISNVEIESDSWYSGPLAASFDFTVKVDGVIIYEIHIMS